MEDKAQTNFLTGIIVESLLGHPPLRKKMYVITDIYMNNTKHNIPIIIDTVYTIQAVPQPSYIYLITISLLVILSSKFWKVQNSCDKLQKT